MGYFDHVTTHSALQCAVICRRENRRQTQPGQTNNYVDGQINMMVRIWLCGDNKEGKRQEVLTSTHCIRHINGWNLMTIWVRLY